MVMCAARILVLISCAACCGAFQSLSFIGSAPSALSSRCAAVHHRGQRACLSPVMMEARDVDCLVIGGGISGLTTAFYADKGGAAVLLAEKAPTLGGVIETQQKDGAQFEDGPNTFQASAKGLLRLVADLGLAGQVVASDPKLPRFVYWGEELYALPKDLPRLLSPLALVRAALGVLLPVAKSGDDESVASFIERTLGSEVLSKVVDPFVSTVYTGDPEKMSLKSVFPAIARVAAQSQEAGGLLVGGIKTRLDKSGPQPRDYGNLPTVPKGASLSFKQGLRQLPEAVQQRLGEKCLCGWEASSLEWQADGTFVAFFKTPSGSASVRAKTVVLSTPPAATASLLAPICPPAADLAKVSAPPVWAVTVAYPSSAFRAEQKCFDEEAGKLAAFGVLIPRASGLKTLGFQFISSLFPERAPVGQEVLLAYYGGAQNSNVKDLAQADVVARVHSDAQAMLLQPNTPLPKVLSVRKWPAGIPQYNVGHSDLVASVRSQVPKGLVLGGNALGGGISLGDCAEGGYKCAQQALALLKSQ